MKTLKEAGVPFGARMVFRLQHTGFLLMALGLLPTLPFACVWAAFSQSGRWFLLGVCEVIQNRAQQVRQHTERLVRLYAGPAD